MIDRYTTFANSSAGRAIVKRLGLPSPPRLRRYRVGDPLVTGTVAVGGSGRLAEPVRGLLTEAGVTLVSAPDFGAHQAALIYDATGIVTAQGLRGLYDFIHPLARSVMTCGRVLVLGTPPGLGGSVEESLAQRALEGFVRSVGKEFGRGITAQLVYVDPGAEANIASTLRFLLSSRSAYVSGQVVRVGPANVSTPDDWARPLASTVALVTGAARGIGAAIARTLARDGAHVVCLDVPSAGEALATVANEVRGEALQLDLTADHAPTALADHVDTRHGGLDVIVHNAGITRDRTVARMTESEWDAVLGVNLNAPVRITAGLLERNLIRPGGRIVAVSSVNGIAGSRGQTNYATSKAGVIGLVQSYAGQLEGISVNAVAPGFIETDMTASMPVMIREAGRRLNSLAQGGLPIDVAETVAWLAAPASLGVNGMVVRVCGQSLVGA